VQASCPIFNFLSFNMTLSTASYAGTKRHHDETSSGFFSKKDPLNHCLPGILPFLSKKDVGNLKATSRLFSCLPVRDHERKLYQDFFCKKGDFSSEAGEWAHKTWDTSSKRPLKVEEVAQSDNTLRKVIKWVAHGWTLHPAAAEVFPPRMSTLLKREGTRDLFIQCVHLCKFITTFMEVFALKKSEGEFERVVVCRDFFYNQPQAVLFFQIEKKSLRSGKPATDALYVKYLISSPANIRSRFNLGKPERVEGAATALIRAVALICIQKNLAGLFLESVDLAVQFYLRIGFTLEKAEKDKHFMILPLRRLMQLQENRESPFYRIATKT